MSWIAVRGGSTDHGLRHGYQMMMDNGGLKRKFKKNRMAAWFLVDP